MTTVEKPILDLMKKPKFMNHKNYINSLLTRKIVIKNLFENQYTML